MSRLPVVWGATDAEVAASYPCDDLLPAGTPLWRAVSVRAAAPEVFRWLCQFRVAPYSYDLIDNRAVPAHAD